MSFTSLDDDQAKVLIRVWRTLEPSGTLAAVAWVKDTQRLY
jgi:hypothetical protein